jgi:hypothetical protein
MESIPLFNPYTMSDDLILKVQTAHESDFKKILSIIQNNQKKMRQNILLFMVRGEWGNLSC